MGHTNITDVSLYINPSPFTPGSVLCKGLSFPQANATLQDILNTAVRSDFCPISYFAEYVPNIGNLISKIFQGGQCYPNDSEHSNTTSKISWKIRKNLIPISNQAINKISVRSHDYFSIAWRQFE